MGFIGKIGVGLTIAGALAAGCGGSASVASGNAARSQHAITFERPDYVTFWSADDVDAVLAAAHVPGGQDCHAYVSITVPKVYADAAAAAPNLSKTWSLEDPANDVEVVLHDGSTQEHLRRTGEVMTTWDLHAGDPWLSGLAQVRTWRAGTEAAKETGVVAGDAGPFGFYYLHLWFYGEHGMGGATIQGVPSDTDEALPELKYDQEPAQWFDSRPASWTYENRIEP